MAHPLAALCAIFLLGGQSAGGPTLTLDDVRGLEAGLDLQAALTSEASEFGVTDGEPVRPLREFSRRYWLASVDGQTRIMGLYILFVGGQGSVSIGEPTMTIDDGGCSVINATFDPRTHVLLTIECNGMA